MNFLNGIPLLIVLALVCSGCGHKKIVAKDCEQAAQTGYYICDPL